MSKNWRKNIIRKYIKNRGEISIDNKYYACIIRGMRYTKKQFDTEYPDDEACLDSVFQNRYGDIDCCPSCGVIGSKFYRVSGRKCYACEWCGYQLHPLAQTIFHKSSTPLKTWFEAIYLFSVSRNGVAATELQRYFGITYKTAHRMARQIRSLMNEKGDMLDGNVEIDETYIGGKHKRALRHSKKSSVFGMVERQGNVKTKHVVSTGARILLPEIESGVAKTATIHTDEWQAYKSLGRRGYAHTTVNHSTLEYVRGTAYTNTIEGFWGQLKRSLDGTYHHVSPKYLQFYLNEFSFRYNHRDEAVYPVLLERVWKLV